VTERKGARPLNVPPATPSSGQGKAARLPEALLHTDSLPEDLVEVGYVSAAYGIRGWLKVEPYAETADALLHARRWWLLPVPPQGGMVVRSDVAGSAAVALRIAQSREHSGTVVAQATGVADRNLAEALKGRRVWIRREDFPAPEDNEYYWVDLIGCAVTNVQGESLGEVSGLIDNGAHQILQVACVLPDGKTGERLIPFVDAFLRTVDTAGKQIVVDWGLDY
jgi:16S rRNA processing protein RimM